jgi:murein L,D-transpeptidase YcbB/YkuD
LLLNDDPVWNRQAIERVLGTRKMRTAFLQSPVPVLLLYWTAWVDADGRVNFRNDLYGRDKLVLQGLASGFRFRKRPVISALQEGPPEISLQGRDAE